MKCHACAGKMVREVRADKVTYKGHSVDIQQPGWYCQNCDEVVLDGPDSAITEAAFVRLKAEVDGILTPQEVARIRKRLGLSQRRAGALLGGGARSFQKYESGTDWVTRAMANLLRLLDRDPARVRELIGGTEKQGQAARARRQPTSCRCASRTARI
jgi:HTH-type transcriptional regulator/antitoxin MqsA